MMRGKSVAEQRTRWQKIARHNLMWWAIVLIADMVFLGVIHLFRPLVPVATFDQSVLLMTTGGMTLYLMFAVFVMSLFIKSDADLATERETRERAELKRLIAIYGIPE